MEQQVEVISQFETFKTITKCKDINEALQHARYLRALFYGPSPEILGSHPNALILIRPLVN